MKKLLLAFCSCLFMNTLQAQYHVIHHYNEHQNPGRLNQDKEYALGGSKPVGWSVIHDGAAATPIWSQTVNLPSFFNFKFNNIPVSSYKVSTSGVLTFDVAATAVPGLNNTTLPSADIPDNSVCIWGLTAAASDKIGYKVFGTAPNRQYWVQFSSFSIPGAPNIFTYWSIVLEETTNKIYLIDHRSANGPTSLTLGVQVNNTTAVMLPGSPNVNGLAGNNPTADENVYYEFVPGTQVNNNLSLDKLTVPDFLKANKTHYITGRVSNLGTTPVTSFNINYQIDNNAPVTSQITGVNLLPNGQTNYNFKHPATWTPQLGFYSLKVWTSNVNGGPDGFADNDTIYMFPEVIEAPKKALHEVFTSSTCGPCLEGNANLRYIELAKPGTYIDIKYQQNYPANPLGTGPDPYNTTESRARHNYYGVTGIPHMDVNGGWNNNAQSYSDQLFNNYSSQQALIAIEGNFSLNGKTITANASIIPFANVSSTNLVAHMVITEKYSVNNVKSNGETEFFNVMKKMMPGANGTNILPLVSGQNTTLSETYTFPATNHLVENFDSLEVVVFVQDRVTKEVFQAENLTKTSQLSVSKEFNPLNLNLYPNPTNGVLTLTYTPKAGEAASVTVYNMLGQRIVAENMKAGSNQLTLDLSGEAAGFYLVNLQAGDKTFTKKVSLVK